MTTPAPEHDPPDAVPAERLWWQSAVVYQIYPRSFADSDGDGIGDLGGIIDRVDYLADLGVDVVWLSPIYKSPQDDNGYDISDYQDVDAAFGTLEQFDTLLAAMHARGMKLMMDLVVNHTSDEHPWFIESRSSKDNPKRDWYWWRRPREGMNAGDPGAEPTNWGSAFSGSAWELDETTGEYFLHLFSKKQPDLNWENPEVREAVYAMMRWWLDRGVDGFRMDVIDFISKDPALPDGPILEGRQYGLGSFICGPRIHEFMHEMHEEVFAGRDGQYLTVGEMPGVTVEHARLFTDQARGEIDMVFQFEHVGIDHGPGGKWDPLPLSLPALKGSLGRWQAGLAESGWNSLYWDNHDQPRAVSRFGDDGQYRVESAKLLATILHLHRGTPYVYQGDEFGMTNYPFTSIDEFRDIESLNHYNEAVAAGDDPAPVLAKMLPMSRDNARTPVQWDSGPNAGFTTGTPWIVVNPNCSTVNAIADMGTPGSVLSHFRKVISLRHDEPVVAWGDFTMLLPEHEQLYVFTRSLSGENGAARHSERGCDGVKLLVVGNFSSGDVSLADVPDIDAWVGAELVLGNYPDPSVAQTTTLRPWEARVYRRTEG
ncbi:MAG TPA: alpha-glucosidase [Actinopolymorphaceae bacterium]|jgi:oligo-1,6-glucosidase